MNKKGIKTYISNAPSNLYLNNTVKHLDFKVIGNYESKTAKVDITDAKTIAKMLSLSHYSAPLLQSFQSESIMAHAILLLESKSNREEQGTYKF
jgi:hypothetical protein